MFDREPGQTKWGRRVINTELDGGVSAGRETERAKGILGLLGKITPVEPEDDLSDLQSTTQDFYTQQEQTVSFEGALSTEFDLKDATDGRRLAENLGWDTSSLKGLKPCDLLERQKGQKRGRR